jgi:hypothetical protein
MKFFKQTTILNLVLQLCLVRILLPISHVSQTYEGNGINTEMHKRSMET